MTKRLDNNKALSLTVFAHSVCSFINFSYITQSRLGCNIGGMFANIFA